MNFSEASSGEQCILLTILCIASVISDNSVICIDEPEISLHPEWQSSFIPLLISSFSNYKNCHFIIASHSPQIISKLNSENSYILRMDDNEFMTANDFNRRSSDYQLATLFNSPGFKNEFLINESLDVLSILSSNKPIEKRLINRIEFLKNTKVRLNFEDPVYSLITTIEKAMVVLNDN